MQEMMDWFCKDKSPTIRDLQLSGRKLCISDLLSPCEVMSIPGEAVDADLTVLTTPENTITYHNALCLSPQNFA